uniref:Cilia- and flagella-associated protein 43 n=1 Tax=Cyprinus carpio carpio TaxID=630221 RepID=A0A9J7Z8Q9_CYPCA
METDARSEGELTEWVQGFNNGTFRFVDKKTTCYTCGNFIVFLDMETKSRKTLQSPGSGIGAFTASGHRRCLAFSDLKLNPSIFVYNYPELEQISLALCDTGPYLVCASSMPDHTISLWNWESGILLCSHPLLGEDVTALVFNPMNWCQIAAVNLSSLTIWNVEKCDNYHLMNAIDLPSADGSVIECEANLSCTLSRKLTHLGPQMPISAIAGLSGDRADDFVPLKQIKPKLCPSALCWSTSSDLYVGSKEGFLLCVNPDTLLVSVLYKPQTELNPTDILLKNIIENNKASVSSLLQSVREAGDVQLWALDDGLCMGSISLQIHVTSMACCPIAQYVVVGTATGDVLFVEMTTKQKPRLVHRVHLYRVPVDHLVFDQGGNFLITGASDSRMFVLNARPSKGFEIIGWIEAPGAIVNLSTQYHTESKQVKVLVLCSKTEREINEGNVLLLLTLFVQQLTGIRKTQKHTIIEADNTCSLMTVLFCVFGTAPNCSSCDIQSRVKPSNAQEAVHLILEKEAGGHLLSPAFLQLSPHQTWLATVGRDGLYVQLQCHSCWQGGVGSVCFTPDSQTLITSGLRDGSLVCSSLRLKLSGAGKANAATQYAQSVADSFESVVSSENTILSKMTDWDPQTQSMASCSSFLTGEVQKQCFLMFMHNIVMTPVVSKQVLQEETQQYAETKKNLRKNIKVLRDTIKAMIQENESLPDMEKLGHQEFNLDVEEQQRMQLEGKQEVNRVRKEIEMENLAKCYQREILKKECWDSMQVKGKAIKAFHSENEVKNYPMKERTEKELEELQRTETMRQIEQEKVILNTISGDKEEEEAEDSKTESPALTGSLSALYGGVNPHLYSQFNLHIREQKINQITLLKDVIYKVKSTFNKEFEAVYKQKEQEINRLREKNKRISEIMTELDLSESLWEPSLTDNECPERVLTVTDSEIKVEKYLTPEQKEKEEQLKQEDERQGLAAKSDNTRDQALSVMMGGVLELKKEDVLRMEVPQPEFMSKPEVQWTEEERKSFKEFEKKAKELSEEKEKYRKEELKIANLVHSIQTEEEILSREKQLSLKLEKARIVKNEIGEELKKHKETVDAFREEYDNTVTEDKLLDKGFRKEFFDVPGHIIDQLYKLYKRRPRVQRIKTQTENNQFKEGALLGTAPSDGLSLMIKAMEELDAPENMPEGLDPFVWERFCLARRAKVESEQKVKLKALTLAEMQAFLQRRTDEDEKAQLEIKNLIDELNSICEEKMRFRLDSMVQIVLQQGQVEVEAGDFIADYTNALLIHRKVIEDLNSTIRALGDQKIASMVECKDFRKGIIQQEWDHRRMRMHLEDLSNKARDIQTLRITQEIQDVWMDLICELILYKSCFDSLFAQTHQKKVEACKKQIKHLDRQGVQMQEKNAALDLKVADMEITVAERRNIYEAVAMGDNQETEAEKNYQDIILRKKLLNIAGAQSEEILILRAELEKLRMKNFPSLSQLDYN